MRKVLEAAMENPGNRYFLGAPTRRQAKSIFWEALKKDTALIRKGKSETELKITLQNNSVTQVVGLHKTDRIEGTPWDGAHITEAGQLDKIKWQENIRPLFSDTNGFCILDGVPEGRNYYYDLALKCWEGQIQRPEPEVGAIGTNPERPEWIHYNWLGSDVLPDEEIERLKDDLSSRMFKQEYEGAFVDYAGLAYWNFGDYNIDSTVEYNPDYPVYIGMDFNVNPMTATFNHIRENKGIETIYQFCEAYLPNSNTWQMVEHIEDEFELDKHSSKKRRFEVNPDSTGASEQSNATKTDIAILRQAGFKVNARSKNPRQKDRINAVNNMFKTASGKVRYKVNPKCKHTIEDYHKVETEDDGSLLKKSEKDGLVHISDAQGYLTYNKFPLMGKDRKVKR
ncbi:MAG: hypothetical protein R6U11_04625 [Bacteroidales bacterium]